MIPLTDLCSLTSSFLFLDFEHWKFIPLAEKVRGHIEELTHQIKHHYSRSSRVSNISSSW